MAENVPPEENLAGEIHALGKNLAEILQSAWERPERKRLQEEIVNGFTTLGNTVKRESDAFVESETGQQLKADIEGLGTRLRSPEVQDKVRQELISVLQMANTELEKLVNRWSVPDDSASQAQENPPAGESSSSSGDAESVR